MLKMARNFASFGKTAISKLITEYRRSRFSTSPVFKNLSSVMSAESLKKKLEEVEQPATKKMKTDSNCVLRFAKLTKNATAPVRGSEFAAGVDLFSAYDVTVPARGKEIVKTDIQVQVPQGSYGRVAPRSGLAAKNFIDVGAGVVDEDYRGNLGVVLFNHSEVDFEVKRGDRIAQFICERIFYPELEEVDKLDETKRGAGGFGSTGVRDISEKNGNGKESEKADNEVTKDKAPETAETTDKAEKTVESAKEEETKSDEKTNGSATAATAVTA